MDIELALNICRVCMKSKECVSLTTDETLLEKFVYTTQLKVESDDIIPDKICAKCVTRMKVAYDFRRLAHESEENLRNFINKVTTEFSEVTKNNSNGGLVDLNDDEMQILIEEGYRGDDTEIINSVTKLPQIELTSKIEDIDQEDTEEFQGIILEDEENSQIYLDENSEETLDDGSTEIIYQFEPDDSQNTGEVSMYLDEQREYQIAEESLVEPIENSIERTVVPPPIKKTKRTLKDRSKKFECKSFICIKCNKDFSSKTNLMRHMISHDGTKPYQCSICGNGFTQNGSLKQHMLIHEGIRPHVCCICNRGFTQSKSLTFHMRRHTGEKPFKCDECGVLFRQRDGLKRHIAVKHCNIQIKNHACSVCDRVLNSKHSLQNHMKKHFDRLDSFKCDKCDEDYPTQNALDAHYRSHGIRPYHCIVCKKSFGRRTTLEIHLKTHDIVKGESKPTIAEIKTDSIEIVDDKVPLKLITQTQKQFQCGKCYKSFSIKRNLLQHLRNHNLSAIKLFTCEECSIGFNSKREMKLHRQGEHKETITDLNECELCNTQFVSVNDLNDHIATTHDLINEDCSICQEHFVSNKALENHLLEHELVSVS